jgi:hypothetical protein
MKKLLALLALLIPAPLFGQTAFAIDELLPVELVQESPDSASFEARWYYTPNQNWTVEYQYEVTRSTGEMMFSGQTAAQMFPFVLPREEADVQYSFRVRVMRLAPSARNGPWSGDTFAVPARDVEMIYALAAPSDTPQIIPHDPVFAIDKGTLWMEFTPDRVTDRQGLFCKDASGYGTGGHLCIAIVNGQIEARIQDDSTTLAEILGGTVVDSTLNQVALEFGTVGFRLWVNGAMVASDPTNGGIANNTEALRIGANAQGAPAGSEEWNFPLVGTMEAVELYNGVYDFSGRWGDVPLPPPGPVDSLTVIRVASMRVWNHISDDPSNLTTATIQYLLPPAGYRYVDYRLNPPQKERLMYEVWMDGAQVGWAADADHGIGDCSLMPGGECENGEIIPVRPFRYS